MNITAKRVEACSEIFILILASFAFSYVIYSGEVGNDNNNLLDKVSSTTPNVLSSLISSAWDKISSPLIPLVSAAPSVCCEKTIEGATCINTDAARCDSNYKSASTSCETTSYCKQGTCYDSKEGICMEDTPKVLCDLSNGTWSEKSAAELPQCQLGCCVIGNQASFVSLVRCKKMATNFGVKMDYRTNIKSETQCIATAQSQDEGACVYDRDFVKTCKFTTRGDCSATEGVINGTNSTLSSGKKFFKGYLCSAEELATDCARQTTTNCYQGDVFWFDSCGNRENAYSSDKVKSWNSGRVLDADKICNANAGTNKDCGNCDFLLGSRCAKYEKGILGIGKPTFGDYLCRKNTCKDSKGNERKNGESWCVYDAATGNGADPAGSRHYKETCVDGEVKVEACGDFRNQICIEDKASTTAGAFSSAACRVNRWQDCASQTDEDECSNSDRRDCAWMAPVIGLGFGLDTGNSAFSNPTGNASFKNPTTSTSAMTGKVIMTGNALFGDEEETTEETTTNRPDGVCVPSFPPGLKFWDSGEAQTVCAQASAKCVVKYEQNIFGSKECVENCECLENDWAMQANDVCKSLGDCGAYVNFVGAYTDDGYEWKVDEEKKSFSPNQENIISGTGKAIMTGNVIVEAVMGIGIVSALFVKMGLVSGQIPKATMDAGVGGGSTSSTTQLGSQIASSGQGPSSTPAPTNAIQYAKASDYTNWAGKPIYTSGNVLSSGTYTSGSFDIATSTGSQAISLTEGQTAAYTIGKEGVGALTISNADGTVAQTIEGINAGGLKAGGEVIGSSGKSGSFLSNLLGAGGGTIADALLTGAQWAAIAYGVGYAIGSVIGLSDWNTQALSISLAGGAATAGILSTGAMFQAGGSYGTFWTYLGTGLGGFAPYLIGAGVAAGIFVLMYEDESTEIVTFNCMPWQAPRGGSNCEKCNDEDLICSEYRCKSLGQSCEIVNKGTDKEQCVNIAPNDVEPPVITPNDTELTSGFKYTDVKSSPPGPGFRIVSNAGNQCAKPFTPLKFGVTTNEPAQCKIDFNSTTKLEDMKYWMGGSNIYSYNHNEQFSLPGPQSFANIENLTPILNNGGKWTYYIRCRDKNGNENTAEYAVRFCIDDAPDTTSPEVKATSIANEGCVAEAQNSTAVEFYVNEPAECKWSKEDKDYKNMENSMLCSSEVYQINALQLYTCRTTLTGLGKDITSYYVRCKDQPNVAENDRNVNTQSYKFSLRGSNRLKIKNLMPNGTLFSGIDPAPISLSVETLFGCDDGKAICYYSTTGRDADYVQFFNTGDVFHNQRQDITQGEHTYYVKCVDGGGNVAMNTTTMVMNIDTSAPVIARVYQEGTDKLLIKTVRNSDCAYSSSDCDFTMNEGTAMPYSNSTTHITDWKKDKTLYIKCRDEFRNEPSDCSIIVRPTENIFKIV